jgi:hypothetical protein
MYELVPLQQGAAVPELKLQTDIESYDDALLMKDRIIILVNTLKNINECFHNLICIML